MDLLSFIPSFGGVLFTLAAFIVALLIIIAVHEYGHYIVGRLSGIKADVFSLGFGPVLWAKSDRHGTKWQIAALPFGGFVRFKGDSDAASGKDTDAAAGLSDEEKRQTMHGAPLWARTATVAAGPIFNLVLSLVVFASIAMTTGIASDPLTIREIYPLPESNYEIREGDALISVEGIPFADADFSERVSELERRDQFDYDIIRDGQALTVSGPLLNPARVGFVDPTGAAHEAGVEVGDVILTVNGEPMRHFNDLIPPISKSDGAPVSLLVWRDGQEISLTMSPIRRDLPSSDGGFETRWLIGISADLFFDPVVETPSLTRAVEIGADRVVGLVTLTFSGVYHMVTGAISSCGVSGPIGIAQMSGSAASQGAMSFFMFVGLLSTAVGLMNLFPVPILDGGHLVFFAYEAVTGRPPNEKVLKVLMTIGLGLLLALMAFAVSNDLFCP